MYLNARPPYRLAASLLTLTAALTGCGGGTEKTPSTPPPSGQISVNFVSPAETNNVHDLGAPVPLLANVNINGNFAPNGTPVTLTLDPSSSASVAPTAPTTVNGIAAAELRSKTLGRLTARAMTMSSSYTASDEIALGRSHLRVQGQPPGCCRHRDRETGYRCGHQWHRYRSRR